MNRRNLLSLSASALAASTALPFLSGGSALQAREARGSGWDNKWMNLFSMELITWMKEDFAKRAALVEQTLLEPCPLKYTYFTDPLSRKDAAFQEDFIAGTVSATAASRHVTTWLKDLETVRLALAAKEAEALPKWKLPTAEEQAMRSGTVYETSINARNLGVILDNSPSMLPYLDKVRAEINRTFSGSYSVEVNGCEMWWSSGRSPWFYATARDTLNPFAPERHCPAVPQIESKDDTAAARKKDPAHYYEPPYQMMWNWKHDAASALLAMVQLMKVDAIYWFTDFDDDLAEETIKRIATPLLEAKVKLYAHTLKSPPPPLVKLLIERSGGQLIKKPIR